MSPELPRGPARVVVIAARNEEERIAATIGSIKTALPGARLVVADDGSTDSTAALAAGAGAELSSIGRRGKGEAVTAAVRLALSGEGAAAKTVVLCDGDLGASAAELRPLVEVVESGQCDLAVAAFSRREGGGFGIALGFARGAIRRLTGLELQAPISGQRALRADLASKLLPFASGFGMETGMTIDAARAGARVVEIELDLEHRATGRTAAGFWHRGRQLLDFVRVYLSRRFRRRVRQQ
jgi:glycosyltransferase involved in cell wall biosynthesis